MKRVNGIGGLFFKSENPQETKDWYKTHLDFNTDDWDVRFGGKMMKEKVSIVGEIQEFEYGKF